MAAVHSKESKTSTAGVAVREGRVFLARRKPGGALSRKWEFPGGKVDPGETPPEGLVREMQEEFGLSVCVVGEPLCRGSFVHRGTPFQLLAFPIEFQGHPLALNEHEEYRWVSPEELSSYDIAPSDQCIVAYLTGKGAEGRVRP